MGLLHDLKTWRFWRHFSINSCAVGGAVSGLLQLHNVLYPEDKFFQGNLTLLAIILISIGFGLLLSWPRPIEAKYNSPNTRISIIKGNLLEQKDHLVIGTCDTFDTEPPIIISKNSLQGQALDILYGGDLKLLDQELSQALKGKPIVGSISKSGKTDKYGIGTVATVKQAGRRLFFAAYCEMDSQNKAGATVDDVWKSLLALWNEISVHSNGSPVAIGVIGGGQARLSNVMPAQDSIRLIALSFMFASRTSKICDELKIVVLPKEYEQLDRLELQSFLSSLRPS